MIDIIFFAELDLCVLPTRRRLLVLVNPNSGPGKAVQIFENSVKSMLEEADIIFQVLITGKLFLYLYVHVNVPIISLGRN